MKKTLLSILFIVLVASINAQITYVNANATGANNGTSWADAYTDLHSATFNTTSGEIWVAAGTYTPSKTFTGNTPGNNRQKTFRIQYNVQVYGGFNGTETMLSQRNWETNVTTLSANVGGGLFAYNIVRMDGNTSSTILDGFTISQGQAGGTTELYGGGIYLTNNSSPIIRNCKFLNNTANQNGGAIYGTGGNPQIESCIFKTNGTSVYDGAAIYLSGVNNVNIYNCLFDGNYAGRHGGAILIINSTNVKIYNNTFVNNSSGTGGAGRAIQVSNTTTTSVLVKNCVFYNNTNATYDVSYNGTVSLTIENCLSSVLAGTSMNNNISGNPQFTDYNNGDYTLLCSSPAVNSGNATGLTIPSTDLNGNPRMLNTIDMGAYENQVTTISVSANKTQICSGDYVILNGSCDNVGYTWSNGVTNNVAFYPTSTQTYTCTGTGTSSTATITIEVITIANETVSGPSNVCKGSTATINMANSINGVEYYLRDNSNDYVIDGPIMGTGSAINFNTNPIYNTTTYNVLGAVNSNLNPIADYSVDFDGSNDKITTNYFFPSTTKLTVEAWIYPEATTYKRIFTNFNGTSINSSDVVFDTYNATNNGRGLRFGLNSYYAASVPNVLTLNTWNHVAATFDAGQIKLYVNGSLVGTFTAPQTMIIPTSARSLTIGEDFSTGANSEFFNGRIDEFRVWTRTLTQSEIAANMNSCLIGNEDSLKLYYRMNEGTGTTITDLSGNGNHGTLTTGDAANHWLGSNISCASTVGINNPNGKALDFDGTNDFVSTTFSLPSLSTFSFEGWIFPRSTNYDRIFSNYSAAVNGAYIIDTYNTTNNGKGIRFSLYGTGNVLYSVTAPNVLTSNDWNHIACTFDNGLMTVYVNGFEVVSGTAPYTSIAQISNYLTFGEDVLIGTAEYLNGKLDEVRVWSKALSQAEVTANMNNCLTGTEANLLAYYNFEEGTGTIVNDITINHFSGTMQNMDQATDWIDGVFTCETSCTLEMTQTVTITPTNIDKTTSINFAEISSNQAGASYQWLDCNNAFAPISGETAQSFTPTVNGSYAVKITLNSCVDTSACVNFNTVSLKNHSAIAFNLYPNPATDILTIKSSELIENIKIYNLLGSLVLTESKTIFSVAELEIGVYIVHIKTAKGIGTARLIKE